MVHATKEEVEEEKIRSRDIRDQTRKLWQIAPNFGRLAGLGTTAVSLTTSIRFVKRLLCILRTQNQM